ncbi:SWIB/MDM2 domain-containing protein [Trametes gibbosa]|nr:SWIB/MDM2 domain-containing protein [Trametes gibbosa]
MSFDAQAIAPKVRAILTAPGTDLATISAKRVRKELLELDASLTPELVREKKNEIDNVISKIYEEVSAERADASADDGASDGTKRKRSDDASEAEQNNPHKKTKKTKKKQEVADEELARQLSNEINGRARTSRAAASGKSKASGAKRGKKGPKSSATVASDGEGGSDGEEEKPKKRGGGFKKEYILSEPLAALLQVEKLSRPQTVKQLWVHIKANNLQNPENGKEIVCDELFKRIFKVDRIDMFEMNKQLSQHLHEAPAPS